MSKATELNPGTPEEMLVKALDCGKMLDPEKRTVFFHLLAAASIAYIRGAEGEAVLEGFLHAAMQDTSTLHLACLEETAIN